MDFSIINAVQIERAARFKVVITNKYLTYLYVHMYVCIHICSKIIQKYNFRFRLCEAKLIGN